SGMSSPPAASSAPSSETGKEFYDLNRDPLVSPYPGKSSPLSFFYAPSALSTIASEAKVAEVAT
ncbi:FYDLN acid domain-containing protein, partial [Rhizobium ruizarguesonis]